MEGVEPALRAAAPSGFTVRVTGLEQIQSVAGSAGSGGPGVLVERLIGGAGALAVLLFVYGSAIAIVPLLIAIPSILASFPLVLGLTHIIDVSFLVQYLVAVIGLGITVDYSLLLVTRWREEREAGRGNQDAILAAAPTAVTPSRARRSGGQGPGLSRLVLSACSVSGLRSRELVHQARSQTVRTRKYGITGICALCK